MSLVLSYPLVFGLVFLLAMVAASLGLVWIAERSPAAPLLRSCAGVVAPYSNLLAILFGLFAAFMANDVSVHSERARSAVSREANATAVVLTIADGLGERGATLKQLAVDFGRKTTGDDWASPARTAEADAQGLKLLREVLFGGLASADTQVKQTAIASIMEMRAARSEMVATAHSETGWLKWIAAFILGVLTLMGVVIVHQGKPRASMLATGLFAVGVAFVLWVVLMRLDPFTGRNSVPLAPIAAAYQGAGR
jgi:hypothetical protein